MDVFFFKADLTIRRQTTNDSDGDNGKLRRRKLSFESDMDKGKGAFIY